MSTTDGWAKPTAPTPCACVYCQTPARPSSPPDEPLTLRCLKCRREMPYERSIDATIPAEVVVIEQTFCDQCDNGDFGTEWWLDAQGREVSQDDRVYPPTPPPTATPDTGEAPSDDFWMKFGPPAAPSTPPPTATLGELLDAMEAGRHEFVECVMGRECICELAAARAAVEEYVAGLEQALHNEINWNTKWAADVTRLRSDVERITAERDSLKEQLAKIRRDFDGCFR